MLFGSIVIQNIFITFTTIKSIGPRFLNLKKKRKKKDEQETQTQNFSESFKSKVETLGCQW